MAIAETADSPPVVNNMTLVTLAFYFLSHSHALQQTDSVLRVIADGISAAHGRLQEAAGEESGEYLEWIAEDECAAVEDLLGATFVVCQGYITRVCSAVKRVRTTAARFGHRLSLPKDRYKLLRIGDSTLESSGIYPAEAIEALANYFKHVAEWQSSWGNVANLASDQQKRTAETMIALGASPASSGNLRRGARILGNPEFDDPMKFVDILDIWRQGVRAACVKDLRTQGAIDRNFE